MEGQQSVTRWLDAAKRGDAQAQQVLWDKFCERLKQFAKKRIRPSQRVIDEEDIVVSAFNSFYKAAQTGRFPKLDNRQDLWRILVAIVKHKATDHDRRWNCAARGGGQVRGDSAWLDEDSNDQPFFDIVSDEPSPAMMASMAEELELRLGELDERQRAVALLKLEGWENAEIAAKISRSVSTVERILRIVRERWERHIDGANTTQ